MSLRGPAGVLYDIVVDPARRGTASAGCCSTPRWPRSRPAARRGSCSPRRSATSPRSALRARRLPAHDDRDDARARHGHEVMEQPRGTDASPLFSLRNVTQQRGDATILNDLTLDLPRTEVTALIGPSGAGKTSLIRLLNRLDDSSEGEVQFDDKPITSYPVFALRRRVGFVFQRPTMFAGTVADNLRVAVTLGAQGPASDAPEIGRVLEAVGLDEEYAEREASRLSGGEQQRVSIARALMTRPEVLLLDEPTSALDPEVAERLLNTVARLSRERGVAVVMVTHRLSEAQRASTFTVMLEAGRLVEAGTTQQIFGGATQARTRATSLPPNEHARCLPSRAGERVGARARRRGHLHVAAARPGARLPHRRHPCARAAVRSGLRARLPLPPPALVECASGAPRHARRGHRHGDAPSGQVERIASPPLGHQWLGHAPQRGPHAGVRHAARRARAARGTTRAT